MRHLIVTLLLLLSTTTNSQNIELSSKTVNFGTIPIKPRTERHVTLYNQTLSPIVIKDVKVDCNCTKIEWNKRPITAGDSTMIKITYIPSESGVFYKKIKITTTKSDDTIIIRGVVK